MEMLEQALDEEFLEFLSKLFSKNNGSEAPHDNVRGPCKCGATHNPYEFQLMAAKMYRERRVKKT